MGKKKNTAKAPTAPTANLLALKIGSRVRCTDDQATGRIVWANAASVKIEWADGEKVTWRRDSLAGRPIEILDADSREDQPQAAPAAVDQAATNEPPPAGDVTVMTAAVEPAKPAPPEQPPADQTATEPAATPEPHTPEMSGSANERKRRRVEKAAKRKAKGGPADTKEKKLSALDAAAKVLAEEGQPMTCQEMIDAMAAKGYRTSPGGKTPAATLYSSILRELTKGAESRFVKTERGKFARNA